MFLIFLLYYYTKLLITHSICYHNRYMTAHRAAKRENAFYESFEASLGYKKCPGSSKTLLIFYSFIDFTVYTQLVTRSQIRWCRDSASRRETMTLYGKYTGVVVKKHETRITIEERESPVQCMRFDRSELHKANYFDLMKFCSGHTCKIITNWKTMWNQILCWYKTKYDFPTFGKWSWKMSMQFSPTQA